MGRKVSGNKKREARRLRETLRNTATTCLLRLLLRLEVIGIYKNCPVPGMGARLRFVEKWNDVPL